MRFLAVLALFGGALISPVCADEATVTLTGTVETATGFDTSIIQGTPLTLTLHFDTTQSAWESNINSAYYYTTDNTLTVGDLTFASYENNVYVESNSSGSYGFSFDIGFATNYDEGLGAPNPTLDAYTSIPLYSKDPTVAPTDALSNVRQLPLGTFTSIAESFTDYPPGWTSGAPAYLTYNLTSFTITEAAPEPPVLVLFLLSMSVIALAGSRQAMLTVS